MIFFNRYNSTLLFFIILLAHAFSHIYSLPEVTITSPSSGSSFVTIQVFEIQGTCNLNNTVEVTTDNGDISATTVAEASWTAVLRNFHAGSITITAIAHCGSEESLPARVYYTACNPPLFSINPIPSFFVGQTITVTGTCEIGNNIALEVNPESATVSNVLVSGTTWSAQLLLLQEAQAALVFL